MTFFAKTHNEQAKEKAKKKNEMATPFNQAAAAAAGATLIDQGEPDSFACLSEAWGIAAVVLVSFVLIAGLVWHITAVMPGVGGMQGQTGGVFLGFVVLALIIGVSLHGTRGDEARNLDWELAAVILGSAVTVIYIVAMSFAWSEWANNKGARSVAWPVTHTIITATLVALNIGLPIEYMKECGDVLVHDAAAAF